MSSSNQSLILINKGTFTMNKISIYAITKNESKFVERWYNSMKEADEIVVLDTGSTDDTVEKLRALGVKVEVKIIEPWDFAVARNEAMKLVSSDCNILVSTDLDEIFEPGWAKVLRDKWNPEVHTRAQYKYVWSHLENDEPGRVFRYNKIHDWNWIWKYPVHELLYNPTTKSENYNSANELYLFDDVILHHFPDKTKSRGSYLGLLEKRERDYPDDLYGLIYLCHEYKYRGFYQKSIDKLNKVLTQYSAELRPVEKASCYLFMGDDYYELKQYREAEHAYLRAIETEPTYREPYLGLANVYLKLQDYELAIYYVKQGLKKSFRHWTWLERDISWTYEPYDLLSLAYYYNGDKVTSLGYAYLAATYDTSNARLKNNIDIIANVLRKEK